MLIELSINPLGSEIEWNEQLAEVLKLADALGLPYQLTPTGTRVEGGGDAIMTLVSQCYDRISRATPHVLTTVRIENDGDFSAV